MERTEKVNYCFYKILRLQSGNSLKREPLLSFVRYLWMGVRPGGNAMRRIRVAATQMSCSWDRTKTLNKADCLVHRAAEQGAHIILLQELFETPYFCQRHSYEYMKLASCN